MSDGLACLVLVKVALQRKQEENNYIHALFIVIEN